MSLPRKCLPYVASQLTFTTTHGIKKYSTLQYCPPILMHLCEGTNNFCQDELFSSLSTSLKGSASRLGRMAKQGNKLAILKLAGMVTVVVVLLWWLWGVVLR